MLIFKCKMCGGDIHAESGVSFGTCDSCQTTSTLPKANDERLVNLFNRANRQRQLNNFDRALANYENILIEDHTNAEAHWCAVLCRYGIEYVEDPKTRERVPTCHRVQSESILSDSDYKAALEYAPDSYARELYETEAKKISEIQKGILAISNREEPYDVFICYKETTDGGSRTKDSTLAQDIYYQLDKKGYKVFFARITLEGKLGKQYEPYIFAALNSAKVMLVIGTKPEYFNAVWVKNEWSRFLTLMKKERSKLLIPCYRDMDAYDIPDELSMYQSQDMGKIGFIQDLIHGVKKVLNADRKADNLSQNIDTLVKPAVPGIESLMKRAYFFLEDEDWEQAFVYFNRVLDIDPEYAPAYIGKVLSELNFKDEVDFQNYDGTLDSKPNFQKALRFADVNYKRTIERYNEIAQKNGIVKKANEKLSDVKSYNETLKELDKIRDYEEADGLITQMESNVRIYAENLLSRSHTTLAIYDEEIRMLEKLGTFGEVDKCVEKLRVEAEKLRKIAERISEGKILKKAAEERLEKEYGERLSELRKKRREAESKAMKATIFNKSKGEAEVVKVYSEIKDMKKHYENKLDILKNTDPICFLEGREPI
ncbi:MAG: TIR domain-containing protein [Oscillospiraceae bacterium]|nr:TIR domain-containing protein [Oscillospiraceae bacterium]